MRRVLTWLATLAAATALMLAAPTAASADPWGGVNCSLTPSDPRCIVEVIYNHGGGGSGSGGGTVVCKIGGVVVECRNEFGWLGSDGCYYGKDGGGGFLALNYWIRTCIDRATGNGIFSGVVWLPRPPIALATITDRAIDQLSMPKPVIAANPPLTSKQMVHVPVWWWVQPGWWQTQTATASAGGLTITARAAPKQITWYAGDGTSTVCKGPGTPWTGSAAPTSPSPTCGHTYTVPSATEDNPNGRLQLHAVATWDITWSGGGLSGSVPSVTTATTTDITVTQLRTVIIG